MRKIFVLWILPIIISLGLFILARPTLAQLAQQEITLAEYLTANDVVVGSEEQNGFRQIFYEYNGNKVFITNSIYTSSDPVTDGKYIAWMSQIDSGWRVFLHDIIAGTTVQLTQGGINVNPKISANSVVWEAQDESGVWQIKLFDGVSVKQLTSGDMSLYPDIEGQVVVYGRKDAAGWRGSAYSLFDDKEVDITTGETAKAPKIRNGKIYLLGESGTEDEFPLTAEDLFVLDLTPLTPDQPETVSEQQILEELTVPTASDSGEI